MYFGKQLRIPTPNTKFTLGLLLNLCIFFRTSLPEYSFGKYTKHFYSRFLLYIKGKTSPTVVHIHITIIIPSLNSAYRSKIYTSDGTYAYCILFGVVHKMLLCIFSSSCVSFYIEREILWCGATVVFCVQKRDVPIGAEVMFISQSPLSLTTLMLYHIGIYTPPHKIHYGCVL